MLQLKNIVKQYGAGENIVTALNGVSISFRENEFVSILGHSGCGKTTMLNIIGGLDHYTSGDLIINGVSTKEYKDRDWDAYRNHSIGFIFQSYNLIPHQTVLANVELALTISGVSASERRKRAIEALEKVGLGGQLHKKPNQMSGGQMQRVAIARALINNPDILLADEPTGALDSETSVQVMELLKEIAKDKLVIMVTHNPELAEQYSTRIVRIKDGSLVSDTAPYEPEKEQPPVKGDKKRVSMSFGTAISLSLNNLMTKKGRTLLTSFAGSIGIIGIALILSLSTGINEYITGIQEDTLASYPLSIFRETADASGMMTAIMQSQGVDVASEDDSGDAEPVQREGVYSNTGVYEMFNAFNTSAKQTNDMKALKELVETNTVITENTSSLAYSYDVKMPVYVKDPNGKIIKSDFYDIWSKTVGLDGATGNGSNFDTMMSMSNFEIWSELLPEENGDPVNEIIKNKYDLVYGSWPENYNEAVIVLNRRNEVPDVVMYTLGFKDSDRLPEIMTSAMKGELIEDYGETQWTYDEVMNKQYKMILPCEYYQKSSDGKGYTDLTETEAGLDYIFNSADIGTDIKITGFIRPAEESGGGMIGGYIAYTNKLTEYVINKTNESEIVKAQKADESVDILSGLAFKPEDYEEPDDAAKAEQAKEYIKDRTEEEKAEIYTFVMSNPSDEEIEQYAENYLSNITRQDLIDQISGAYAEEMGIDTEAMLSYIDQMDDETLFGYAAQGIEEQFKSGYSEQVTAQLASFTPAQLAMQLDTSDFTDAQYAKVFDEYIPAVFSDRDVDKVYDEMGCADLDDPDSVFIYAKTFAEKDKISEEIEAYNDRMGEDGEIHYTDYVALLMSSITDIINGISYVLIAFVAISLIVSSIMIGIITYISVLERTREIGILRAIGASKHDVSTVFNAETLLVGFTSGLIGIGVSALLIIPINMIIKSLTGIDNLKAVLPVEGAVILVIISMVLTLIAGLIPSGVAAKKDPVEALRTE